MSFFECASDDCDDPLHHAQIVEHRDHGGEKYDDGQDVEGEDKADVFTHYTAEQEVDACSAVIE